MHYLAYGSNLHPLRLAERAPSATVLGVVSMPRRRLVFCKRSVDGSGKCMLLETGDESDVAYGVVYVLSMRDKARLDTIEGVGNGYYAQRTRCLVNGVAHTPYLYEAQASHVDLSLRPYHWYKALVIAGARYHRLPDDYVAVIASVAARPDPDENRVQRNRRLLSQMAPPTRCARS